LNHESEIGTQHLRHLLDQQQSQGTFQGSWSAFRHPATPPQRFTTHLHINYTTCINYTAPPSSTDPPATDPVIYRTVRLEEIEDHPKETQTITKATETRSEPHHRDLLG
jgi:hypothetical protein